MKIIITSLCVILSLLILCFNFEKPVKSEPVYPTTIYVSKNELNFNRWSKGSTPTTSFVISSHNGSLKIVLTPSQNWINLSETSIDSNLKEITVTLDVSNFKPGLYKEKLEIKSNRGSYTLPIRLDLVEKKVVVQMFLDSNYVVIDTKPISLDAAPFIMKGVIYVPLRVVCESFGATVTFEYIGKERVQTINILYKDQRKIKLFFNKSYMEVEGIKINIDGPIINRVNTAFIPLNTIKDIFKPDIQFNSDFRLITLIN